MQIRSVILALALAASACATSPMVSDRLFFGQNIPAGGTVSTADWQKFVAEVVTPRFPDGMTISQGNGQWLDPRGNLVHEQVFVIEVVHDRSAEANEKIEAIAVEYKKRFGQDAVMRVTEPSTMRFY